MMTASQLCLIFIFSFVLGTQSQSSSSPAPGSQTLPPGSQTLPPGNQSVTPGSQTVTPALQLNNTLNPDGTTELLDNLTLTELVTFLPEDDSVITDMTTPPITTSAPSEISTSASPSGICTPPCGANANCSVVEGLSKCVCVEGYIEVGENYSTCEVKTCDNIQCGAQGQCIGNSTVFYECDCNPNFSFKEGDICIAKTCNNSCNSSTEHCSDDKSGYNCTCIEGYSRQGDDCMKDPLPTTEPNLTVTTGTPLPAETLMSTDNLETPELTTEPIEATTSAKPAKTTKSQKTAGSTKPTKPSESSTSSSTPNKKDITGGHNYTGALIGLFIFLVVTCFVFVAVYVVRRRKLRNNYGRLDEDNEGDSGWSAFSKNPIYRGDRDYQLL